MNTWLITGQCIAQICQAMGISESTFHSWRNQYGALRERKPSI